MPAGNGTGPRGLGRMTGCAAGYCAGFGMPGHANPAVGRGFCLGRGAGAFGGRAFGCGRGGGRGWRHLYYATGRPGWMRAGWAPGAAPYMAAPDSEEELARLRQQAEALTKASERVRERLQKLEAKQPEK